MSNSGITTPTAEAAPGGRRSALKLVAAAAALVAFYLLARQTGQYIPQFAAWVEGLFFFGPLVFIAGYALATVAFVPGALLTLAGGAIFVLLYFTFYFFFSSLLCSSVSFPFSPFLVRGAGRRRLGVGGLLGGRLLSRHGRKAPLSGPRVAGNRQA